MERYVTIDKLAVGYDGHVLLRDICLSLEKGKILTLIGPNGAGKSTILKTLIRQLAAIRGKVTIGGRTLEDWPPREMAKRLAVVLTDRIRPELMTCAEVVAMGRYPYTNLFGKLTAEDTAAVESALRRVHALDLAQQDFATLSDGQRQRIMLARAICQEPEVIVLDEPTAYLDIRYKIELLDILRNMARQGVTIIMSLHEIDLAAKVSDYLLCVGQDGKLTFGAPEEILRRGAIEDLYGLGGGSYDLLFGSVELSKPKGAPRVFVVAGGGYGAECYRLLQKREVPFATGILFENDVDAQVANALSDHVITVPAFEMVTEDDFRRAAALLDGCTAVVDAGTPIGTLNRWNGELLKRAEEEHLPLYRYQK